MSTHTFTQVDVFTDTPLLGNPLAVVHGAQDLSEDQMRAVARWTNLSETTFLLPPTKPEADYRVRIFTPQRELPFAGHPTLGSCHAWLEAGGVPRSRSAQPGAVAEVVQECAVGLIRIRRGTKRLAFAAPPRLRTGPLDSATLQQICAGLSISSDQILGHQWVDNGPGWCAVRLASSSAVLALKPDWAALRGLKLGVVGAIDAAAASTLPTHADFEVRALIGEAVGYEDPVTGSLNASLAQWLIESGVAPASYVASQGTQLQRCGRVFIEQIDGQVWVGGGSTSCIRGTIHL
jgi:PhzF family phenazine biosynthesis protein